MQLQMIKRFVKTEKAVDDVFCHVERQRNICYLSVLGRRDGSG